ERGMPKRRPDGDKPEMSRTVGLLLGAMLFAWFIGLGVQSIWDTSGLSPSGLRFGMPRSSVRP
ncbi:MAG: hypothetical protein AAFR84_18280, partial [Pseudomonadota bacterium]